MRAKFGGRSVDARRREVRYQLLFVCLFGCLYVTLRADTVPAEGYIVT